MSSLRSSNFFDILLWLFKQRQRFRVEGLSMLPLLSPGDEVLVDQCAYQRENPRVDDIVVIYRPDNLEMRLIKRIVALRQDGNCFVEGDNALHSTDSRIFGWIPPQLIFGRVTCQFF